MLRYLAALLFSAFNFKLQPGEAEAMLMAQCSDPQGEVKCVCGGGFLYVLV